MWGSRLLTRLVRLFFRSRAGIYAKAAGQFSLTGLVALCVCFLLQAEAQTTGAIVFSGLKNDGSFNELAHEGTKRAIDQLNLDIQEWVATDEQEVFGVLRSLAKHGADHLVTLGFTNTEAVRTVAKEYPDAKFTHIDGLIADMPNVRSILFSEQQSGFVAGYVAGLKSTSSKVGTIGATGIPPVRRFMCGFAAGAKHADASIDVLATYLGPNSGAFRDIGAGKLAAEKMLAQGADIIFAPAGLAAEGVAKAAQEAGAHVIMVDANRNAFIPGTVLTSALKRVDEAAFATWQSVADGTWTAGVEIMTVRENGVDWAVDEHNKALIVDIENAVSDVKSALADGTLAIEPVENVAGCDEIL